MRYKKRSSCYNYPVTKPVAAHWRTVSWMQELVNRCQNRKMAFDNRTKEEKKLKEQTAELLRMVDAVVAANGGEPYSNALFKEAQVGESTEGSQLKSSRLLLTWFCIFNRHGLFGTKLSARSSIWTHRWTPHVYLFILRKCRP